MILPAQTIRKLCLGDRPMISPFSERAHHCGISHGLGPAGYDLRIDRAITLWPGRSIRADAFEKIYMPADVMGLLFTKSTWARLHIEHAGTTIDPGFCGTLRLEINMHAGDEPIRIPEMVGIVHVIFIRLEAPTEQPYNGKYQHQTADQDAILQLVPGPHSR